VTFNSDMTYSTNVATTPNGSAATTDSFCVQGKTLYLFPSGQSGANEEIVLTQ
jgi:hypothetical protein